MADAVGLAVGEHGAAPHLHPDRRGGLRGDILQHVGALLSRVDIHLDVQHVGDRADAGLQPLLDGDLPGPRLLGGGGQRAHVFIVGTVQAGVLGIARLGHLRQQGGVLIVAHHDHVAVDLIIRYAVVLEVGHDLADFRRRQALIQLRVRLLAHGHRQRDHSDQDHSQGGGQYDAQFLAHIFEKVLDLFPKTLQL